MFDGIPEDYENQVESEEAERFLATRQVHQTP